MAYNNLAELFKAIAEAIRSKTGSADPIVANDFPTAIGGISGCGVDDGYFIQWDGNTEGRDTVDVLGRFTFYKVSNLVFDMAKSTGSFLRLDQAGYTNKYLDYRWGKDDLVAVGGDGWSAVMLGSSNVVVISGVTGTHTFNGSDVYIPSDGTYFFFHEDIGFIDIFAKPAAT